MRQSGCLCSRARPQRHARLTPVPTFHHSTQHSSTAVHPPRKAPASFLSAAPLPADLSSLTVLQLKERLRECGLPVSGRKSQLIDRLQGAINAHSADSGSDKGPSTETHGLQQQQARAAPDLASPSSASLPLPTAATADERQGVTAAARIATAVTVEALLEQMGMDGEEGEDEEAHELLMDTSVVVPWLKDRVARVSNDSAGWGNRVGGQTGRQRDVQSHPEASGKATYSQADPNFPQDGLSPSQLAAALSKCPSVDAVAAVVAAAIRQRPLMRLHCCAAIQRLARVAPKDSPSPSPILHQLVGELCVGLLDQLHFCDVRLLSTLLWSLGRLGFQPVGEFSCGGRVRQLEPGYFASSIIACLNMMDEYGWRRARPVDLVDILEGLVRLELDECELAADVLKRLQDQLFRADSYCVSHALWACSKLPALPPDFAPAAARRLTRLCSQSIRPFEMITALTGCVHLGYRDSALLAAVNRRAAQMLPQMQATDISMLCWALASLDDTDTTFLRSVIQQITRWMSPSQLTPRMLVSVLWSAARSDMYSAPLLECSLKFLLPQLPKMPSGMLVQALWSLAKLEHYNQKLYEDMADILKDRLQELDPQALSSVLWSYARIGVSPPALLPLITSLLSSQQPEGWASWSAQDLAMAAWALALLEAVSEAVDASLLQQLLVEAQCRGSKSFSRAELAQVFQVYMKLSDEAGRYGAVLQQVQQQCADVLEAGRLAWMDNMQENQNKASRSCYEIAGVLTSLGYAVQLEQPTEDGLLSIDIALQLDDSTRVAVEVDGPSHFTNSSPRRYLGPSLCRNKSLQARGWHVLNVPLHELSHKKTSEERKAWIQERLQAAQESIKNAMGAPGRDQLQQEMIPA